MKLDTKAMAIAFGVLWGLCMLAMGLGNLIWAGYGEAFLQLMASIYPGYHATRGITEVVVGALYGAADGFIGGAILAWVYNRFFGSVPAEKAASTKAAA